MTTATEAVTRTCPDSAVVDQILTWAEVREGDLVLLNDDLTVAEKVHVYQDVWDYQTRETFTRVDICHTLPNGHVVCSERHGDRYTAVRRYVTEGDGNG